MADLSDLRVAIVATDGFEETELTSPAAALRSAGAKVDIVSLEPGKIQAFHHHDKTIQVDVNCTLDEVKPEEYNALMLPGGALNADSTRMDPQVQSFVRAFQGAGKPIAAICHAPWILISAGLVRGRTLTSYKTIQDDIKNAGGTWLNEKAVVDGNWLTSRQPSDLSAFNEKMLNLFEEYGNQSTQDIHKIA